MAKEDQVGEMIAFLRDLWPGCQTVVLPGPKPNVRYVHAYQFGRRVDARWVEFHGL